MPYAQGSQGNFLEKLLNRPEIEPVTQICSSFLRTTSDFAQLPIFSWNSPSSLTVVSRFAWEFNHDFPNDHFRSYPGNPPCKSQDIHSKVSWKFLPEGTREFSPIIPQKCFVPHEPLLHISSGTPLSRKFIRSVDANELFQGFPGIPPWILQEYFKEFHKNCGRISSIFLKTYPRFFSKFLL